MRSITFTVIVLILLSCNSRKNKRESNVYIDGEKVELNPSDEFDTNDIKSIINDTSYFHNKRIEGLEGEGIIDCNLDYMYWIDSIRINRFLNDKDIYTFLKSIEPQCEDFEEYKLEISRCIWSCFRENPSGFLFALSATLTKGQKEYILHEIKYPSIDVIRIDLNLIEVKKMRNIDTSIINEIIEANTLKIEE